MKHLTLLIAPLMISIFVAPYIAAWWATLSSVGATLATLPGVGQ